jgi:hypothetical protein
MSTADLFMGKRPVGTALAQAGRAIFGFTGVAIVILATLTLRYVIFEYFHGNDRMIGKLWTTSIQHDG